MRRVTEKVAEFTDLHGEQRTIHRSKGARLQVARLRTTPALALNQAVAVLIGQRIRALREERGMSLADLCIRAGLVASNPKQRMYEIERGIRREGIRLGTLYALALALRVEPGAFMPATAEVMREAEVSEVPLPVTLAVNGRVELQHAHVNK